MTAAAGTRSGARARDARARDSARDALRTSARALMRAPARRDKMRAYSAYARANEDKRPPRKGGEVKLYGARASDKKMARR